MRRKKLLTAALCAVLTMASWSISSTISNQKLIVKTGVVSAASLDETDKDNITEKSVKSAENSSDSEAANQSESKAKSGTSQSETSSSKSEKTSASQSETTKEANNSQSETTKETGTSQSETQKETSASQSETTKETSASQSETTKETNASQTETEKQTSTSQSEKQTESHTQGTTESSDESQTSGTTESESQTEASAQTPSETDTEQLPSETVPGTEPSTEVPGAVLPEQTLSGETDVTETETETTEGESETETEEESESETSEFDSNEELIRHQNIVRPPDIKLEFRFTQIEAQYAVVQNREGASVYESKSEDAREVGTLAYYGVCCILEDKGDGWYYVESRNVRGFVKAEELVSGEVAQRIVNIKGLEELPEARLLVARTENEAFEYTHTTTQEVIAEKVYALADGDVKIYEQRKETAPVTGTLADGALCYILADEKKDWIYVESGNARGFVKKEDLITGREADKIVEETGENNMTLAEVKIDPEDNSACYYTLTSVKKASESAKLREDIVNFALDYLGNPYVWGGTSLTNGADCSGFVQTVYAHFGYYLPRVADAQSVYGMQIPIDSAVPGDLIFYARNGYVYHVSMYIGNGQVVHAAGRKLGIITSGINSNAVWATRIITD